VKNNTSLKVIGIPFLPFSLCTIVLLRSIDTLIWSSFFKLINHFKKYDAVIVTHPLLGRYFLKSDIKIIYDCHDDNEEFYENGPLKRLIKSENNILLNRSSINVFSSSYLLSKYIVNSYDVLIRNGHDNLTIKEKKITEGPFKIFYFGSISSWFDFELIEILLRQNPEISFELIGPNDIEMPQNERIKYHGSMPHNKMLELSKTADAFIMPFKINELILGVDPVKLYEYISFKVPVISIYYEEVKHFNPLIEFYSSADAADLIVKKLVKESKSFPENALNERYNFLLASSWLKRSKQFIRMINEI
jgi:hypothetical protein